MSMYKNIFVDELLAGTEAGEQTIDVNGNVRVYGETAFSSLDEAVEGLKGGALICVVQSGKYTYYTVNDARELSVAQQVVYVNFNGGENLSYDNAAGYSVSDVDIAPAAYTAEQKSYVIQTLNANAQDGVVYVDETPAGGDFSTVHVGATDSFDALGSFKGISETIDAGNLVKNDEAFVNTDNITDIADLVNTIEHETGHLTGEAHDTTTGTVNDYAETVVIYLDPENTVIGTTPVSIGTSAVVNKTVTMAASENGYSMNVGEGNSYAGVIGGSVLSKSATTVESTIANKTSVVMTDGAVTNQDFTKYITFGDVKYLAGPYVGLNIVGGHIDFSGGAVTLEKMASCSVT